MSDKSVSSNKYPGNPFKKEEINKKNISAIIDIHSQKKSESEIEHLFNQFWAKTETQKIKTRKINSWLKYAAIFVALIGLNLAVLNFLTSSKYQPVSHTYSTQKGSVSKTVLPDGSVVWLNSNSELTVVEEKYQVVTSLKGEAFFDIIHNNNRNFIVNVGNIKIKDLGTKFNIKAYEHLNNIETYLQEGDLEIFDDNNNLLSNLDPGQKFYIESNGDYHVESDLEAATFISWMHGKFVFKGETLESICQQLESWYHVDILIDDENLKNEKFTLIIKRSQTIDPVLKMLSITDTIQYEIINKPTGPDQILIRK